jgi:ribonuclease HI
VATILTATIISPNISVIVAPNPEINYNSPPQQRGCGNNNNANNQQTSNSENNQPDINNNTNNEVKNNNLNNFINNPNHSVTSEERETTQQINPRSRQYLISQFFPTKNYIRNTMPTYNHPINDNEVHHNTTDQTIRNLNQQEIYTNTDIQNSAAQLGAPTTIHEPTEKARRKKFYIQQHIMKQPIPNDFWGSSMDSNKNECFRIYYQNINGITSSDSMEKWNDHVSSMKDNCCEIFGLAETNTNWKCPNIKTELDNIINKTFPHSSTIFSSNKFNPTDVSRYQPGGALQSCTGHWVSRCIDKIHDNRNMGRWTGQTFQLKQQKILTVITAYRPCKRSNINSKSTSSSSYRQQTVMLMEEGYNDPDPRQIFIEDMISLIININKNADNYIILMLDANENINDSESGLSKLLRETSLIDIFSHIGGEDCNIPTFIRGTRKIDYIFSTANLLPYIKHAGCLPFFMNNNSDHRGMFIDISEELLDTKLDLKKPDKRHIGTKSSNLDIYQYKKYIDHQFKRHRIYEKTDDLLLQATIQPTSVLELSINKLDSSITEIMLSAEKKCCRARYESQWSIAIHVSSLVCKYWLKMFKGIRNNIDVTLQLDIIYSRLPETNQADITLLTNNKNQKEKLLISRQQLRLNISSKKQLLYNHQELRKHSLLQLQERYAIKGAQKEATIVSKIATKEMKKADWAKLRNMFNPKLKSGITNIEVPDKDVNGNKTNDPEKAISWQRISDPAKIEECLLNRNIRHFGQAEGSFFTTPNIQQLFNYEGISCHVTNLLQGTFDYTQLPNTTKSATCLLQTLSNEKRLNKFDNIITFTEFKQAFSKWNESTSTSPSGRHLGHYKCLLKHDHCDKLYNQYYQDPKEKIIQVYYNIIKASIQLGISLNRWQNSTTAMIEKLPGCPKINKLRVIHLYEADYNIILKIIWARKLVWHVHDNNRINEGQAGSRPGFNAIDVVIQKEMKYLYSRLTKTHLATMDNDAKSCYDRIICNLAMIISQYYGISHNMALLQATTLKKMKFRLRTALGDSKRTYQHTSVTPIHGTGQGSCASPAIWLLISSILMDCLSELGGGMTMLDVHNNNALQQWIDGFVDDTSLFTNISQFTDNPELIQITNQLTGDMIIWKDLLEASGGKLELSKCFYYILSWQFDDEGNASPMTISEQRVHHVNQIEIPDTNGSQTFIQQKEVNKAHKTLGCYKAIDGNEKEQISYLQTKSKKFSRCLYTANLSRKQANMAYKMIYIPSMKYGLPACSLSHNTIESIQNSTLDKFLPYMGYDHGSPRALIYGPIEMGGAEIPHLYTEMMGMKLESIISHIRAGTVLGKSFMININNIQLCSGIEKPIFSCRDDISYLDHNWLLHLRAYLIEINGTLDIKHLWQPTKQRENDIILMSEIKTLGFSKLELKLINNWRIYFQVSTLVELCTPDGTSIQQCFLTQPSGPLVDKANPSNIIWPAQGKPGKRGFSLWYKALSLCFNMRNKGQLTYNFGRWISSENILKVNTWQYYIHPISGCLYTKEDDMYYYMFPLIFRKNYATYDDEGDCYGVSNLPSECYPAAIRHNKSKRIYIANYSTIQNKSAAAKDDLHWTDPFLDHTIIADTQKTIELMSKMDSNIYIVSDGGVYNYDGTFGVVISDGTNPLIKNHGKLYSLDFCESSYRSELYAMLAGVLTLQAVSNEYGELSGNHVKVHLLSDNKALVRKISNRLKNRRTTNQHRDSDVDLELQLMHEILKLQSQNITIKVAFVRSHQELRKVKSALSHVESLNVLADSLTKAARKFKRPTTYISLPKNPIELTINNKNINSYYAHRSKKAFHSIQLREYLQIKHAWSNRTIDNIWWQIYNLSLLNLNSHEKTIIFKFIHNRLPTKARDNKYYNFRSKHCDQCQCDSEDDDHIILCRSVNRQQHRQDWIHEIETYLSEFHTPASIRKAILHHLSNWLEPNSKAEHDEFLNQEDIIKVTAKQQDIGWSHFIRGRLSIDWGNLINNHLGSANITSINAEKWGTDLLRINWKYVLKIWRERCDELHGKTSEQNECYEKNRLIEEIQDIQQNNSNLAHSQHAWILEELDSLKNYSSKVLQTWVYGAKLISKRNQTQLKQKIRKNKENEQLWYKTKTKPIDEPIEKGDLDPGE